MTLRLNVLPGSLCIARLPAAAELPAWLRWEPPLTAVYRTPNELSIVCPEDLVPRDIEAARGWRAFAVDGPLDLDQTGVLAAIAAPLAEAEIALFAVSTFDTDYVLVREADLERARKILAAFLA